MNDSIIFAKETARERSECVCFFIGKSLSLSYSTTTTTTTIYKKKYLPLTIDPRVPLTNRRHSPPEDMTWRLTS